MSCRQQMMAAARVRKAWWISSRISRRMRRRRTQCSSVIAGSIIHWYASRHLLQVAARAEVRPSFGLWTDSAYQRIRAPADPDAGARVPRGCDDEAEPGDMRGGRAASAAVTQRVRDSSRSWICWFTGSCQLVAKSTCSQPSTSTWRNSSRMDGSAPRSRSKRITST